MKQYTITQKTPKYENCKIGMKAEDDQDAIRKAPFVVTGIIKRIEEVDEVGGHIAYIWESPEHEN